jgi:hypothetical protein
VSKKPFKSLETLFYVAVLLGLGYVIVLLLVKL